MSYFTGRFKSAIITEIGKYGLLQMREEQAAPTPEVGTTCTIVGMTRTMEPCESPPPYTTDGGRNHLRGALHGVAIERGGTFVYRGRCEDGHHVFEDIEGVFEGQLWLIDEEEI